MQNLEIEALRELENNIPYDYCRSCDSSDGLYHEWIDEDSWQYRIKMLLEEKDKEIERLNNIINEIEKDLDKQLEFCINEEKGTINGKYCRIAINYLKHLKSKLQKLKGDERDV